MLLFDRFTALQSLADKAKLLRKEAKSVQHMVMKDEVWTGSVVQVGSLQAVSSKSISLLFALKRVGVMP